MLEKLTVNQIGDNTCVKVYDPVKKKLIAVFENYKKTGMKLGVTASVVYHTCVRKGKTYSPFLKQEVALRLSSYKDGDRERIQYCNKKTVLNEKS